MVKTLTATFIDYGIVIIILYKNLINKSFPSYLVSSLSLPCHVNSAGF